MSQYVTKRALLIIPTLLLVSVIVFALIRLVPGDVVDLMYGEFGYGGSRDALREQLGLNRPIYLQYLSWIGHVVTGDFGKSLWTKRTITQELQQRAPVTLELGTLALLISLSLAIPIGVLSALRQDTAVDYLARSLAILGISVPGFWIATMVVLFPAIWWRYAPPDTYIPLIQDPLGNLRQFLIPAAILGAVSTGTVMRMTRAMMLEVMRSDYIRTAWSKGLRERMVIYRHALRNAIIPVVTIVGLQIPALLGGSVIMENIFSLPGIGNFTLDIITKRDYPMLQIINLFFAAMVMTVNLAIDLTYAILDPRIRYR